MVSSIEISFEMVAIEFILKFMCLNKNSKEVTHS